MHTDSSHCNLYVTTVSTGCEVPAERMEWDSLSQGRWLPYEGGVTEDKPSPLYLPQCPGAGQQSLT